MRGSPLIPTMAGLAVLCLFALALAGGCTQSYDREMQQATDLVTSAAGRISYLSENRNISEVDVVTLRSSAAGARTDVTEAIRILERIPQEKLSEKDRTSLQASLVACSVLQKICTMLEGSYASFVDHSQNLSVSQDPGYEARMMLASLEGMSVEIDAMEQEIQGLDEGDLPPDIRGDYVTLKVAVQSLGTEIDETIQTLKSTCLKSCPAGEIIGTDCLCHPRCGTGNTYCAGDGVCCQGNCYLPCPKGYTMDSRCICIS